jgi:cytochrome c
MRIGMLLSICLNMFPLTCQAAAIHDAAKTGDVGAITAALDAGADVNELDAFATPLYHAVNRQHLDAAKLLIERGADVNAATKTGGTSLSAAVAKNSPEFIKLLLAHGANPNTAAGKQAPLHVAAKNGCLECVVALVEAGADVNAKTGDAVPLTPIHFAKFYDYSEVSEYLLANGVVLPKPAQITEKLVAADVEKGRQYFASKCDGCHNTDASKGDRTGPNLWGVVGRDKASAVEFEYSHALRDWEGTWTYEDLNIFLSNPVLTTPGIRMEVQGVSDETERVNLIGYLRTLSDSPVPLP